MTVYVNGQECGLSTTQRVLVRITQNGEDSFEVYYVDKTYVSGRLNAISAEGHYEIRVDA